MNRALNFLPELLVLAATLLTLPLHSDDAASTNQAPATPTDPQPVPVAWAYHSDLPASLVYQKPGDKNLTLVAWNEFETPVTCHVCKGDRPIAQVTVPSRTLSSLPVPLPRRESKRG